MVQHRTEADKFLVRARTRGDLERLDKQLDCDIVIMEKPKGDYRWQAAVPKHLFTLYMIDSFNDLDYTTNVKGTIDCGEPKRHSAMMRCWSAMATLQEGGPYGGDRLTANDFPAYTGPPLWDDPEFDPLDFHDPEDLVSVELNGLVHEVTLWSVHGKPQVVASFTDEEQANTLARSIRDTAATWDNFYDYDYTPEGN